MSNSSIWPIDRNLSVITTLDQSELGSDTNEGVHYILQNVVCTFIGIYSPCWLGSMAQINQQIISIR